MSDKIRATHLERRAVVYLRQSTLRQIHEHHESTARQYDLRQRALDLGWPAERIDIIDEDLGQSGASASWRTGFQRLAEEVAHGRVGAIFSLEVSRLARSSADWHRLLELCGLADVLLADEQSVYTPRDYNDRLLLGLKGTMSEAELYWMHLRLQGAKLSKARRGALYWRRSSCSAGFRSRPARSLPHFAPQWGPVISSVSRGAMAAGESRVQASGLPSARISSAKRLRREPALSHGREDRNPALLDDRFHRGEPVSDDQHRAALLTGPAADRPHSRFRLLQCWVLPALHFTSKADQGAQVPQLSSKEPSPRGTW